MAIKATVETTYGEDRECYIRLNNVEVNNHGAQCVALFRGYASEEAFKAGKAYLWEQTIELKPDVSKPLWEQTYKALKEGDPAAPEEQELQQILDDHEKRRKAAPKDEPPPPAPDTSVLENRVALARKLRDSLRNAKDV